MTPVNDQHRKNSAKGGRIGGPKSPSNFKNNPELAKKAGAKGGQARAGKKLVDCDLCDTRYVDGRRHEHMKAHHPNLYRKEQAETGGIADA